MERREFLDKAGKTSLGIAASGTLFSLLNGCSSAGKKWNIVFVLTDDQGWNTVNYHGFGFYETPNMDRIAEEGMFFTDAYAAPVCSPTRASLMTGKYPARVHLTDYIPGNPWPYRKLATPKQEERLSLDEITIPEMLKKKGYVTGHFGKWHLNYDKNYEPGRPGDPASQGFDEVLTTVKPKPDADPKGDAHHSVEITDRSLQFIEKHQDEPFFCYVSYHSVHRPLMEDPEWVKKYKDKPDSHLDENNPIMAAMIERMDNGIGQILDQLEQLGLSENTIVIYYSDNGGFEELQDQTPLYGGKATIFEGGIKVPLAIKWPGVIQPGSKCITPVISNDFFPTIMEMTRTSFDKTDIDGKSLITLLKQKGNIDRDAIYFHYPHYHHQGFKPASAIREGDYKLIEWYEASLLDQPGQINLYNVREDVGETNDLAKKMPDLAQRLRDKLHKWRMEVGAQEMIINSDYNPKKAHIKREK